MLSFIPVTLSRGHRLPSSLSDPSSVLFSQVTTGNILSPWMNLQISLGFNIIGNIWDNVSKSAQINDISSKSSFNEMFESRS